MAAGRQPVEWWCDIGSVTPCRVPNLSLSWRADAALAGRRGLASRQGVPAPSRAQLCRPAQSRTHGR